MSVYSSAEIKWDSGKKHSLRAANGEDSPSKRQCQRPSLAQRLGLATDSDDQSDSEPYSPSQETSISNSRQSTFTSAGTASKAILQLLKDADEDDDDEEEESPMEEAYSPSQLDPATMDEVSDQLKGITSTVNYVPPSSTTHQQDIDYRETDTKDKKKANTPLRGDTSCRSIPIHGEWACVDPRLRIYSARLRSKVRQLALERLSSSISPSIDRNQILDELDHLVESHGKRLYWYRVICFLQNISVSNNTPKQTHAYLKEVSRLLVLSPTLSKLLKIKQRYPKRIPLDSTEQQSTTDPRSTSTRHNNNQLKLLTYN